MRRPASHLAAIALGVVLVVLGHDAVMASDPHAPAPRVTHAAAHAHAPGHTAHASAPREAPLDHPDGAPCGPTVGIRPQAGDDFDVAGFAPAIIATVVPPTAMLSALPTTWVAPDHPPDVRRALLQVFLN